MKITHQVLMDLGAIKDERGVYHLLLHRAEFKISPHTEGVYSFDGHLVTDVEEMIPFAYHDGWDDGMENKAKEICEALGVRL